MTPRPARPARPHTHVHALEATPGELRFSVTIDGIARTIWLRSSEPVVAGGDVALALTLLPAMTRGSRLRIDAPVDESLLRRIPDIQAVLRSWNRAGAWPMAAAFAHEVEIECTALESPQRPGDRRVAAFFSGGVDSFAAVLEHPEITHLIYVAGLDVPVDRADVHARVAEHVEGVAARLGKSLITVETNVRELSDRHLEGVAYFGALLGGVARFLSGAVARVYIASSLDYGFLYPNGSHPLLDHLWGGDGLEVVHTGATMTRVEKVARIADDEVAQQSLRVCWKSPASELNCGRCEKCLRTMVALEALGMLGRFESLPDTIDLAAVAATRPPTPPEANFWRENLELAVRRGVRPELLEAIEACLAGVEPAARLARSVGASRLIRAATQSQPMLHMSPSTWFELRRRRAAIFLIGSYDGSGNYGDIAQLQATLELLSELGEDVMILPVIDLRYLESHSNMELATTSNFDPAHPLVFALPATDVARRATEARLVPAALPETTVHTATYLYGGGYLNKRWATRMLRMAEATEALGRSQQVVSHEMISTGLQVEPSWARALNVDHRELLGRLQMIGVRDELSARAAAELADADGAPPVVRTGDDAVGVIAGPTKAPRTPAGATGVLALNLHICAEPWVTDDPERALGFISRFLDGLGRAARMPVHVQPVIAYEDRRISERPTLDLFTSPGRRPAAVKAVAEPLVLRPAGLERAVEVLRGADLTVGCSYHVSLTSLLAGVPAVLLVENDYYAQKADGLRRDFELERDFFCSMASDPSAAAARVIAHLRADGAPRALPEALRGKREQVVARRAAVEERVLERLRAEFRRLPAESGGRSATIAAADYAALLIACERAFGQLGAARDSAVAELEAVSALFDERGDLLREREDLLREVFGSASWRLTRPLRAAGRAARGSRGGGLY